MKFLLVVQISLNDYYILRYKFISFGVMFVREKNQTAIMRGWNWKLKFLKNY